MERMSKDDRKAFETVYNRYFVQVYHLSMKFVADREAAEDITLETFVKLWDRRSAMESDSKIGPYLCTIARNACLNYLRDRQRMTARHQELALLESNNQLSFEAFADPESEIYRRLYLEIEQLPGKSAAVIKFSLQGMKNEEIARQLNINEKTVRNLKTAAIKQLRLTLLKVDFMLLLVLLSR
ncbi:RNA polymerase sigma-70 factor [Chitinophaga arvensicola]|nr:RNA polymerase sigma-70 factor [Chitinophaga arvensicola]